MESEFKLILNKDENIIATYKPNKAKFYITSIFISIFLYAFLIMFFTFSFALPDENGETMPLVVYIILMSILAFLVVLQIIFTRMAFKKRIYCITNQRLIIKCGIIGVDFRSLDLKFIGAIDVYVSFLDKIVRKNTGTIRFGSMSSPMNNNATQFAFSNITAPYELYQSIKQTIDENRNK